MRRGIAPPEKSSTDGVDLCRPSLNRRTDPSIPNVWLSTKSVAGKAVNPAKAVFVIRNDKGATPPDATP